MLGLLQSLLNADNAVRRRAEEEFDSSLKSAPDQLMLGLTASCVDMSADKTLRGLAIILLRRVLTRQPELWIDVLQQDTRRRIQWELLQLLDSPDFTDSSMRKKLCYSISIVALMTFDADQEWPELLPNMFRSVSNPASTQVQKENALNLFMNLSDHIREHYEKDFPRIAAILINLSAANEALEVRLAATRAGWCLVEACSQDTDDELLNPFKPLVGNSLSVITAAIVANHSKCAEPIEDLIDLLGTPHSRLLSKKDIERAIQIMLELAGLPKQQSREQSVSSRLRILALELVICLMETRGAVVRKIKPPENAVVIAIMPILISMMMELPELNDAQLASWGRRYPINACSASASQHFDDEDDCADLIGFDFEAFGASLEYVDRMCRAIKPKHVLPIVFARAAELVQASKNGNTSWKYPHSALLMLAHVVEFVNKKEPELGELCRTASMYAAENPHMRVRHAGFTLLARLAYDCAPQTQQKHSQVVVGAFLRGLADPVPRVQAHAAIALINYCSSCQEHEVYEEGLKPYLADVVNGLFTALQTSPQIVQENVISALASVSKTAETDFLPFYSSMPILKAALESLNDTQYSLKARIIDCMATIGSSVGREVFLQDAMWMLQLLESTPLIGDDPNVVHIQAAWMVLSQVLGEDIGPYLHRIVRFTLDMANKLVEDDDDDDDIERDDADQDPDAAREEQIEQHMVRTAAVDDRLLALELLCSFACNTGKAFAPFLEQTLTIFFRDVRLENCAHDDIRSRVAAGFPDMVRSALACTHAGVMTGEVFQRIFMQSLEVLCVSSNTEDTLDALKLIVRSIMEMNQTVHDLVVSSGNDACPDYVEPCCAVLVQLIRDSVQRRALEFATLNCDTAEDEMDEEAQMDYEEKVQDEHELHFLLTGAIGALIRANPKSFVPAAFVKDSVGPHVFDLAHHVRLCHDQKVAVFILDDIIEYSAIDTISSELLAKISTQLLLSLKVEKSTSPSEGMAEVANLVQAAAYGLGVCAQRFGNSWSFAPDAARELIKIIQTAPKDLRLSDDNYGCCLDNCASALMKIARECPAVLSQRGGLSQDILLEAWLDYFPLQSDLQESKMNSFALIKMMSEERLPFLLSPKGLALSVRAFANIIGTDHLEEAQVDTALRLLEQVKTQVGSEVFAQAVKSVPREQLQRLSSRLGH